MYPNSIYVSVTGYSVLLACAAAQLIATFGLDELFNGGQTNEKFFEKPYSCSNRQSLVECPGEF